MGKMFSSVTKLDVVLQVSSRIIAIRISSRNRDLVRLQELKLSVVLEFTKEQLEMELQQNLVHTGVAGERLLAKYLSITLTVKQMKRI